MTLCHLELSHQESPESPSWDCLSSHKSLQSGYHDFRVHSFMPASGGETEALRLDGLGMATVCHYFGLCSLRMQRASYPIPWSFFSYAHFSCLIMVAGDRPRSQWAKGTSLARPLGRSPWPISPRAPEGKGRRSTHHEQVQHPPWPFWASLQFWGGQLVPLQKAWPWLPCFSRTGSPD